MNFLACTGNWQVIEGSITCDSTLVTLTSQELAAELKTQSAVSPEEVSLLIDATTLLFAIVFGFLVLKKVL